MSTNISEDKGARILSLVMMAAYDDFDGAIRIAKEEGIPFERNSIVNKARFFCGDEVADLLEIQWEAQEIVASAPAVESGMRPVIQSFKAFASALGERIALEVGEIVAAVFQPPTIAGLRSATRMMDSGDVNSSNATPELHNWRLWLIEENRDPVRLSLQTDFPSTGSVEFVVFGVNSGAFESLTKAASDSKQVAGDAIRVLWSGSIQTDEDDNDAEISFAMPKDLKIVDKDSHYNIELQQDAQGVWGVILKVEPC